MTLTAQLVVAVPSACFQHLSGIAISLVKMAVLLSIFKIKVKITQFECRFTPSPSPRWCARTSSQPSCAFVGVSTSSQLSKPLHAAKRRDSFVPAQRKKKRSRSMMMDAVTGRMDLHTFDTHWKNKKILLQQLHATTAAATTAPVGLTSCV